MTAVAVAALVLAAAGCEGDGHVEWLPDSSGFVFTDKAGTRLVHFDVGKQAKRVVAEDPQGDCRWPAVSPDGTRFAVATATRQHTAGSREVVTTTRVVIYDRDGTEKQRSKAFEVTESRPERAEKTETFTFPWGVCWRGHKDRLLTPVGIYDRAKDTWIKLPAHLLLNPFHGFAPTDKGFLAARPLKPEDKDERRHVVSFVDWDGWSADFDEPVALGPGVSGRWDGQVWHLVTADGRYAFDCEKRKVAFAKGADPTWEALHRPSAHHRLAGGELYLTAFSTYDVKSETTKASLELQVPDKKKRKVIYAEGEYTSVTLFPSPDGKRVAVWCRHPGEAEVYDPLKKAMVPRVPPLPKKSAIVVFDDRGEVVATVDPE